MNEANFWKSVQNQRAMYERFAKSKGGDPLNPNFWYQANAEKLRSFKVRVFLYIYLFFV